MKPAVRISFAKARVQPPLLLAWILVLVIGACNAKRSARTLGEPRTAVSGASSSTDGGGSVLAAPLGAVRSSHIARSRSFPVARTRLTIENVGMSTQLDTVLSKGDADVVVNGGFFDANGEPLGLAVSDGKRLSRFSPRMSGGVLWVRDGVAHLTATEEYHEDSVDFAIQCRPRLVVDAKVNIRSDDGRRAHRTALCLRDEGREIELVVARSSGRENGDDGGPTLLEFANELLEIGCAQALNLDGGPSTGWAAKGDGGPVIEPPLGPVRHAVVAHLQ